MKDDAPCCQYYNQETTDDDVVIYPDLCRCICHVNEGEQ